jgi:hypothetical protein
VRLFAHWQLDKQTYRRLHNVTLNTPEGTTQIDHVLLSPYGIFVLETTLQAISGLGGCERQGKATPSLRHLHSGMHSYRRRFSRTVTEQSSNRCIEIHSDHLNQTPKQFEFE